MTRSRRPHPYPFASVLFLAGWIAACLVLGAGGARARTADDTLMIAVSADIISPDPARITRHAVSEAVHSLLYDTLIRFDPEGGGYSPGLAASFRAVDALTWEFDLAGETANAAAAAAEIARYFRRIVSPSGLGGFPAPARERLARVRDVRAEGSRIIFHLSEPWPGLPAALVREPAVRALADGSLRPTGAFVLERWDHGNRVILRRQGETPAGGFARVWFEVVPSAEERFRRLVAGEFDIAFDLPPDGYWRLRRARGVTPVVVPQTRVHFVEFDVTRPPFSDARVRRAFNLAVDVRALIQATMQDQAVEAATVVSPAMLGFEPEVVPLGYDPVRARELLAQAGYPDGFEFELDVTPARRRIAEGYRAMLAEVGIDAVVRVWDDWAAQRREVALGRRYAWVTEWNARSLDPREALWEKLHSTGSGNWGGYRNVTLDTLLERAEATLDPHERLERYREIQRYVRQEAPYLFGYVEYDVYGAAADLVWRPGPAGLLALGDVRRR